jgi:carbonic anhydrase
MAANEIDWLLDGFRVFKRHHYAHSPELLHRLTVEGQSPKVAVVACCDSRVDPAIILDAAPGDLFVIRNVANLVPPCESGGGGRYHGTSAALEFAVRGLEVSQVIVLGHFGCGGIGALVEGSPWVHKEAHFLAPWISMASGARDQALTEVGETHREARLRACEKRAVVASLDNLMTFPWIQRRVQAEKLTLHGWYFDLETMALQRYDAASDSFVLLA